MPQKRTQTSECGDFSAWINPCDFFERKIGINDVSGYLWGLKNIEPSSGKELEMHERPCLVDIHGGPHYFRDAYYMECLNILVNQGYLILAINYSGSWTFSAELNDRLAGKMGKFFLCSLLKLAKVKSMSKK